MYVLKHALKEACACVGRKAWNWLEGAEKREEYLLKKAVEAVGAWDVDIDEDE